MRPSTTCDARAGARLRPPVHRTTRVAARDDRAGASLLDAAARFPDERLKALGSSWRGLNESEAQRRLVEHGFNEVRKDRGPSAVRLLLGNFTHTLALLLWFAAGLALAARAVPLAIAIVAVIAVNGLFAFVQEWRAERVLQALTAQVQVFARVTRDGRERTVPARELVPGDLLQLDAGAIVPADCMIVASRTLSLDLSMLTGETVPVARDAEPHPSDTHVSMVELRCVAPAGALVSTGTSQGVVIATGNDSAVGRVATLLRSVERGTSFLEQQIRRLSRTTAIIAVATGTATLSAAVLAGRADIIAALTFATGVIVALVPEGLLPTLSVALAMGARRMSERGALVRRLAAIEIVGATTVVCTDKTGTLTTNVLRVRRFVAASGRTDIHRLAGLAAVLCNDARVADGAARFGGDPIDVALAVWASELGIELSSSRETCPRTDEIVFDARRRFMSVTCILDGERRRFVKGAPEALQGLTAARHPPHISRAIELAAARGERVLALAEGPVDGPLTLLGVLELQDPPRPEVPAAVAACRRAGIKIVMLTGDHVATARGLGQQIGFADRDTHAVVGDDIDGLSDAELTNLLRTDVIVARVTPEQKLRVVQTMRRAGHVVAVTGDGVNDAPALRAADVGVAMGARGTEVAKQAADIVLRDDNFATLVAAIEEGRAIKANIRRFVSYVFTSNVAEVVPFLLFIFGLVPLPLTIVQVLAIDLGTDMLPALALGTEPPSERTMDVAPESPRAPLLGRSLAVRTFLFYGVIEAALGMAAFLAVFGVHGWRPPGSFGPFANYGGEASTLTFLGIVGGQVGCLVAQRSGGPAARVSLGRNPWIGLAWVAEIGLVLGFVYVPGLKHAFTMTAVQPLWLLAIPAGAIVMAGADEVRRRLHHEWG
ncbi:MAG: cation-transporting P-type ATPase [Polyangiaceae bacterium]|nr:cation-transporting P-type ATPase [Polyangiaceae bacterium]